MYSSAHPTPTDHPSLSPPETYMLYLWVTHLSAHSYHTEPPHIDPPITQNTLTKITPRLTHITQDLYSICHIPKLS
ncbi:hypothetical protein BS17DRAFT_791552 [Gyrodon lividus]|nr:hypothetical protein BS17DRAFT_791552 [Gyrodon lividus]